MVIIVVIEHLSGCLSPHSPFLHPPWEIWLVGQWYRPPSHPSHVEYLEEVGNLACLGQKKSDHGIAPLLMLNA